MNRILRGAVVLAASALFAGCNTEPDETQGGDPQRIVVNPAVVFVDLADSNAVLVRLVDQQGTALNSPLTISDVTGGISVSADSMFRPVFNPDGTLGVETRNTELRLFVRGNSLAAGSFTVTGGGISVDVPAYVTPTETAPVASTVAPGIGEPVTLTLEPGLTFSNDPHLEDASGNVISETMSVSEDGTSATFTLIPGSPADFSIVGVVPAYNTALDLTVPSTVQITAGTNPVGLPGVDAAATAPALRPLTMSNSSGVVDIGTEFPGADNGAGGDGVRYYRLVVEESGIYDFELSWAGGKDLGVYLYDENGEFLDLIADGLGLGSGGQPEHGDEIELEAGTYTIGIVWYDYTTAAQPGPHPFPAFIHLSIHPHL
jgi:hypothetical protein